MRMGDVVERNICHRKPNKAVITQLREEKHANVFSSSFFQQRRLLTYRIRSNFFGKVRSHANNNTFLF